MEETPVAFNSVMNWWDDFEWAKYEPGSFHRNLLLYSIGLSMKAKTTVGIGIGQITHEFTIFKTSVPLLKSAS